MMFCYTILYFVRRYLPNCFCAGKKVFLNFNDLIHSYYKKTAFFLKRLPINVTFLGKLAKDS